MWIIIRSRNETVISTPGVLYVLRPGYLFIGLLVGTVPLGLEMQVNVYQYYTSVE